MIWSSDPAFLGRLEELKEDISILQRIRANGADATTVTSQLTKVTEQMEGVFYEMERKCQVVEEGLVSGRFSSADAYILEEVRGLQRQFGEILSALKGA